MEKHQPVLVSYIARQLSVAQDPDEVYKQLEAAGWPEEQIHQAFLTVRTQTSAPSASQGEPDQPPPQANGQRRGRLHTGWVLLKQSIRLLNGNRYLFRYLLVTWAVIMGTEVALGLITYFGSNLFATSSGADNPLWYLFVFLSYVLIYFIINFYAAALAANILDIFRGTRKPYHAYIEVTRRKAGPILVFSVIEAIIGIFLRYVVERIRFAGWIIVWLLGTAWSLGTMFVLPMIMDSDVSAPQAIKQSIRFFKQTWGEGVVAKATINVPLGLITLLVILVFWPILLITLLSGSFAAFLTLAIVYLFIQITVAIIGSFANSVVNAALYYYATTRQIPPGFSADMLNRIFVQRKGRFGKKKNSGSTHAHPASAA